MPRTTHPIQIFKDKYPGYLTVPGLYIGRQEKSVCFWKLFQGRALLITEEQFAEIYNQYFNQEFLLSELNKDEK